MLIMRVHSILGRKIGKRSEFGKLKLSGLQYPNPQALELIFKKKLNRTYLDGNVPLILSRFLQGAFF